MIVDNRESKVVRHNLTQIIDMFSKIRKQISTKDFFNQNGIWERELYDWKNGRTKPIVSSLEKLCKTLGTNTDEFISKKMKISYTININIEYEDK